MKNINDNYILVDGMNGSATKNRKCMDENNNKRVSSLFRREQKNTSIAVDNTSTGSLHPCKANLT